MLSISGQISFLVSLLNKQVLNIHIFYELYCKVHIIEIKFKK